MVNKYDRLDGPNSPMPPFGSVPGPTIPKRCPHPPSTPEKSGAVWTGSYSMSLILPLPPTPFGSSLPPYSLSPAAPTRTTRRSPAQYCGLRPYPHRQYAGKKKAGMKNYRPWRLPLDKKHSSFLIPQVIPLTAKYRLYTAWDAASSQRPPSKAKERIMYRAEARVPVQQFDSCGNSHPRKQLRSKSGSENDTNIERPNIFRLDLSNTTHVAQNRCHLSPSMSNCQHGGSHVVRKFARTPASSSLFLCEIPLVFLISTASSCNTPSPSWSGPLVIPLVGDLLVGQRQPFHFGSQVRLRPSSKAHVCVCVVKDLQSDLRFVECPIIFMFQENPGRIVRLMTLIDPFLAMGAAEGHTLLS